MSRGRLPDFLGIGAEKAGSSWLWRNLRAHPDIWMPPVKELHYFDEKALGLRDRGARARIGARRRRQLRWRLRADLASRSLGDLGWDLRYFLGRPSDAWYASLFRPAGKRLAGEITPYYAALDADRVRRVHQLLPETRILFLMRNPIERAWSQASGFEARAHVGRDAVLRQLEGEPSRLQTDYARTLDNWGAHYPPDRIFIGFLEDVHFHPDELLRRVYRFLGVGDAPAAPHADEQVNRGVAATIPTDVVVRLAHLYDELIDDLDRTFGGYARWWRYCRDRLLEPTDRTETAYPFYETELWDDWLAARNGGGLPLQSGRLDEIRQHVAL